METKHMTCIECPKGCALSVDIENCKVVNVAGNECPKGEKYAISEAEDPKRVLTSVILAEGLAVRMVPVRTDGPIPKKMLPGAMKEIKKLRISESVKSREVIVKNFMSLGVNLITTRSV